MTHEPLVHFGQTERDFLSFGFHPDLGAGTHSALVAGDLEFLAIADQGDWLLRQQHAAGTASASSRRRRRSRAGRRRSGPHRQHRTAQDQHPFRGCRSSPLLPRIQATDITRAHGGVPGRLDLAGVVSDDAVVLAVVEHDVGIGDAGHRTVQVVDRQGPVADATPVVIIESGIDFRKIHRLGIDEFRTADGASGTDPRAREQQPGKRSRFRRSLSWKFTNVVFTTSSR